MGTVPWIGVAPRTGTCYRQAIRGRRQVDSKEILIILGKSCSRDNEASGCLRGNLKFVNLSIDIIAGHINKHQNADSRLRFFVTE